MTSRQVTPPPGSVPGSAPGSDATVTWAAPHAVAERSEAAGTAPPHVLMPWSVLLLALLLPACGLSQKLHKPRLVSPHDTRQVWAVAPLNNESGSQAVDALRLSDRLVGHFERVAGVDTVPLNRVLAAMERLELPAVTTVNQALALRRALDVDGLVVGVVSAYDPYDPPKLGLIVELYHGDRAPYASVNVRNLRHAAVEQDARPHREPAAGPAQPVSRVSAFFDAADPYVQQQLEAYGRQHSVADDDKVRTGILTKYDPIGPRLYRISSDLYGDFATFQVVRRLIDEEARRLHPEPTATRNPTPPADG